MLRELLEQKKSSIVDRWVESVLGSYPPGSLKFFKSQKDRFANPVGYAISSAAARSFDELIGGNDPGKIREALSEVIKIRAVQAFSPSDATRFVFALKKVVRDEVGEEIYEPKGYEELVDFESGIDVMALVAFDLYMDSREKVFQIRVNEVKSRSLQALVQDGGQ